MKCQILMACAQKSNKTNGNETQTWQKEMKSIAKRKTTQNPQTLKRQRRRVQLPTRRDDFVEVLVRRSCEDPAEIHKEVLAWSCTGPYEKILWRSWWNAILHDLVQVLVTRSCGDLGEILSKRLALSRTGPCEKILWRSCLNQPQEVLAVRSWRCSALVLVWKFFSDVHRKFFYEDLVRYRRSFFDNLLKFS